MQIPSRSNASALANTSFSRPLTKGAQGLPSKPMATAGVPDMKSTRGDGANLAARVEAWASQVMGRLEGLDGSLSGEGSQRMKTTHGEFQANVDTLLEGIRSGALDGAGVAQSMGSILGGLKSGMAGVRASMGKDDTGLEPVAAMQASKGASALDGTMRANESRAVHATLGADAQAALATSSDMSPAERVAMLREQILDRLGNAAGIDSETLRGVGERLNSEFGEVLDGLAAGTLQLDDVGPGVVSSIRNLVAGLQAPVDPMTGVDPMAPESTAMLAPESADATLAMSAAETTQIQDRLAAWADQTEHRLSLLASSADGLSAGSVDATRNAYMDSLRDLSSAVANGSLSGADVGAQMAQIMESLRGDLQELFPTADSGRLYGRDAMGTDAPGPSGQVDLSV